MVGGRYLKCERMCVRCVRVAVALRRDVDLVGLPVAVPAAHTVWVWCGFPSGSFTVARATLGGRATNDLADECGEVTGGIEITIERESALIAAAGPFGQAQLGFHHTTARTGLGGRVPPVREVHGAAGPEGFVLDLAAQFGHPDPGDAPGQPPVAQHPGHVEVLLRHRFDGCCRVRSPGISGWR